jgi:triosephosphate isomerase
MHSVLIACGILGLATNVFVSSSHAFASFKLNQSIMRNVANERDESSRLILQPILGSRDNKSNLKISQLYHRQHGLSTLQMLSDFLGDDETVIPFQPITNNNRRPIIAGNWKLNPSTLSEAITLLKLISANFIHHDRASSNNSQDSQDGVDVVIFPPFPFLLTAITLLEGTGIKVGSQNVGLQTKGAFTGEVSPSMLASLGCEYVMLGHSERRVLFKETDDDINLKLKLCLAEGKTNASGRLSVILCVGETEEEYNNDLLASIVDVQVKKALKSVSVEDLDRIVIA